MTKTNEPQDPFKATQNESKGTSSHDNNDGWGEPTPPHNEGWDQEIPEDSGWQQTAASKEDDSKDLWSDNLSSESVEEAFLALIQSNKSQEEAEVSSDNYSQSENIPPQKVQSVLDESISEDMDNPFRSVSQSSLEANVQQNTPENELRPFQSAAAEEGSLHERLAEEIFSDMRAEELPGAEGQSITDALSETIAESLAELQSGQAAAETAELANQVRQELASQPPAMPEFPNSNPVDVFNSNQLEQEVSPKEFVPSVMPYAALEENLSSTNNNDVVKQQHTQPISFENQKTPPPHNLKQSQEPQYTREFPAVGAPAQLNPPNAIHLETQNGVERTNVDPEFQALVQWNNSGVEPSHQGPNDIPNFLSQKREEESKFSFKTVFISLGITAVVVSMFYMGFQAGRIKPTDETASTYDATPRDLRKQENQAEYEKPGKSDDAGKMFARDNNGEQVVREAKVRPSVKPKASISVFTVKNLSGTSGRTIPMNIRLEGNNLGLKTMLLFRGIPSEIALSSGLRREELWSVPISELDSLSLVVPDSYKGQFTFEVFAFKDKESSPERRLASVSIASQPQTASLNTGVRINNNNEQPVVKNNQQTAVLTDDVNPGNQSENSKSIESREPEQKQRIRPQPIRKKAAPVVSPHVEKSMLQRGNELLKNGDISGARLVFEHIASLGSKHAAYALGRTYDENYIDQLLSSGVVPEKELAVKWYKKAAALGHREAEERLSNMGLR